MSETFYLETGEKILLTAQNFVAEGGEGRVFVQDAWAYKIAHDPQKVLPPAKLRELSVLEHPLILRPHALVYDAKRHAAGFKMPYVADTLALPRLFTHDFRRQFALENHQILQLLAQMQSTLSFIHQQQCLLIDGNEINYLVSSDCSTPYFIDVDSYQTPSFPGTALMPSIQDYHSHGFSPLTDWFAFAVVACQLLLGIHPYKGKHPKLKTLAERMQANISIFNKSVSLPATVRDFSVIPPAWRDWFIALFEQGTRCAPPALPADFKVISVPLTISTSAERFQMRLLKTYPAAIRQHYHALGKTWVIAGNQVFSEQGIWELPEPTAPVLYEPNQGIFLAAVLNKGLLQIENLSTHERISTQLAAQRLLQINNQLYVIQRDQLIAVAITRFGKNLLVSAGRSWQIMPKAHQVFEGLLSQTVFGQTYLIIPYLPTACLIQNIPELQPYKLISGKHQNGVVMLLGYQQGRYDLIILCFDLQYQQYQARIIPDRDMAELNFTTLDNGTVIAIFQDGELEVSHRHLPPVKTIADPHISSMMRLSHAENMGLFYTDRQLYQISLKAP
ncbi:MAG: hypothetical protein PHP00_07945 [Thiotrichaceae bacterium]|nr:hypothetical protein [Thiotrichaceae bacterium]